MNLSIKTLYKTLLQTYGEQGWWPLDGKYNKRNKSKKLTDDEIFEISVGAILTQNAAWKNVEKSLDNLRKANALNKNGIKNISREKLAELIKSSVYHNQKAKKLKLFSQSNYTTREDLLSMWGIGPETADSILLYAYRKPIFVVDAYTKRIFSRLGMISKDSSYDEVQGFFMKNLEKDVEMFNEYHALLVEHAKIYCKVKPNCKECPLLNLCEYGRSL